jgi:hypothetical protein
MVEVGLQSPADRRFLALPAVIRRAGCRRKLACHGHRVKEREGKAEFPRTMLVFQALQHPDMQKIAAYCQLFQTLVAKKNPTSWA